MRPSRGWLGVATVAVATLGIAGCSGGSASGSAPSSSPTHLRAQVASEVHDALNHSGVPVQNGKVSCEGPGPDGSIHCLADTAYEPAAGVEATFPVPPNDGSSCPGKLQITVGGSPLVSLSEDPCRR